VAADTSQNLRDGRQGPSGQSGASKPFRAEKMSVVYCMKNIYMKGLLIFDFCQTYHATSCSVRSTSPLNFDCHSFATYSPAVVLFSSLFSRMFKKSGFVPRSARPFLA